MKKILLFAVFLLTISSYSQTDSNEIQLKNISFSDLLKEITKGDDSVYTLKNTFVKFDEKKDIKYRLFEYRFKGKEYPADTIHIYKTINFENVYFEKNNNLYNYAFINFFFHKPIKIKNTYNFTSFNCTFNNNFSYTNISTDKKNSLWITDCVFNKEVKIKDITDNKQFHITLTNNIFNDFDSDKYTECLTNSLLLISSSTDYFNFDKNIINYKRASFLIQVSSNHATFLENVIHSNNWNYLLLNNLGNLTLIKNKIETNLLFDIDKIKPEYNVQWPLTKLKVIPLNYIFFNLKKIKKFDNITLDSLYQNERVSDEFYYKIELTQLSKFHSYFKNFHDRQSANDVYIKIKNLETERLEELYIKDKSFKNFFELIVNRFLKTFSDYGTSPSKIVISSFNIILIFAFLFLFSTNSWNKLNFNGLNKRIKQSINYFTSDDSIINAFEINQNKIIENNSVKDMLEKNRKQVPKVFYFFSLLLLNIQTKLSQIKLSFWNYLNIVKNSWNELSAFKRVFMSVLLLGVILIYILSKIISVFLNSLTLSINSFTTLGFGEIPIKGIGRYLAIIEGFIGWIFLTLFSVTLISQILS